VYLGAPYAFINKVFLLIKKKVFQSYFSVCLSGAIKGFLFPICYFFSA